ncbi:MAG: hypothetical protein AMXMBFR25_06830 [Lysobacterales bacterium]
MAAPVARTGVADVQVALVAYFEFQRRKRHQALAQPLQASTHRRFVDNMNGADRWNGARMVRNPPGPVHSPPFAPA